jgi:hypothetical protein
VSTGASFFGVRVGVGWDALVPATDIQLLKRIKGTRKGASSGKEKARDRITINRIAGTRNRKRNPASLPGRRSRKE